MTLPCYRRDYAGEFLVTETRWTQGIKEQHREWVPNRIQNQHISGRAAVILSDQDRDQFDYRRLQRHRGGLLGKKRLQTYATGGIWRDMTLDFYVTKDQIQIQDIVAAGYHERSTVYATPRIVLSFPGRLYLIPQAPAMDAESSVVYLAAFDGHQEIFLIGANRETAWSTASAVESIAQIIRAYDTAQFVAVGIESAMPDQWRRAPNFRVMRYREWISYCDI